MDIMDIENGFSYWLKGQLLARGMTQSDLAREAGITEAAVSRYISGIRQPTLSSFARMLYALGLRVSITEK